MKQIIYGIGLVAIIAIIVLISALWIIKPQPCLQCIKTVITAEQAVNLIAKQYPKLIEARGDTNIPENRIKQTDSGWKIDVFWGLCEKCHCVFEVKNDGEIKVIDKGETPAMCEPSKNTDSQNEIGLDISDQYQLSPAPYYSIKKNTIQEQETSLPCDGCLRARQIKIQIPCQNHFSEPLWKNGCPPDINILEKKKNGSWQAISQTSCKNERIFQNLGVCDLYFILPIEEVDIITYETKQANIKGTYRVKINFEYQCLPVLINKENTVHQEPGNCKEAFALSPEFEIID